MKLKEIRRSNGLKQKEVALAIDIPLRTYQNYEREEREPDSDVLCALADFYQVTVDELIGRESSETIGESTLLTLFRQLNQYGRIKLIEVADDMVMSGKYEKKDGKNNSVREDREAIA